MTEILCSCDNSCSGFFSGILLIIFFILLIASFLKIFTEPVFFQAILEIDGESYSLFHIYQPSGVLPPLPSEGGCKFFVDTYGEIYFLSIQ